MSPKLPEGGGGRSITQDLLPCLLVNRNVSVLKLLRRRRRHRPKRKGEEEAAATLTEELEAEFLSFSLCGGGREEEEETAAANVMKLDGAKRVGCFLKDVTCR